MKSFLQKLRLSPSEDSSAKTQGQGCDLLPDYLDASHRRSLESLFRDYEIILRTSRYWHLYREWKIQWRKTGDSLFLFPFQGGLRATIAGRQFVAKPGEFLMIPENVSHACEMEGDFRRHEILAIHCNIHDQWGRNPLLRFPSLIGQLPDLKSWRQILSEMTCMLNHEQKFAPLRGEAILAELLAWQLRRWPEAMAEAPQGDRRVSTVIEEMKRKFSHPPLSVEELAALVHLRPVHLRKIFKQETGVSPKQFLNTLRMREAAHLLQHSTVSVKEVSAACGFSSDHYFHPAFRREFGCTPSEYRRRFQLGK